MTWKNDPSQIQRMTKMIRVQNKFRNNMKEWPNSESLVVILLSKTRCLFPKSFWNKFIFDNSGPNCISHFKNDPKRQIRTVSLLSWPAEFFWSSIEFLFSLRFKTKSENRSQVHTLCPIVCWRIKASRCAWMFSHAWFTRVCLCSDCVCAYRMWCIGSFLKCVFGFFLKCIESFLECIFDPVRIPYFMLWLCVHNFNLVY